VLFGILLKSAAIDNFPQVEAQIILQSKIENEVNGYVA